MKMLLVSLGGLMFGAGLVVSGMTDPSRVVGFLDITGNWDPALAFVMGGAVITFAIGKFILTKTLSSSATYKLPDLSAEPLKKQLIIGSAIFGIGWGLGGFCPGPAIANLATLQIEALVFFPLMLIGMILAQRTLKLDA
ncbi:MAG: DUF6691 family protein [Akkermansiaceae bacterium]